MTISQNNRLLKSLLSSTEKDNIVKSLEAFQVEANNAITQMIQLLDNEANEASKCLLYIPNKTSK